VPHHAVCVFNYVLLGNEPAAHPVIHVFRHAEQYYDALRGLRHSPLHNFADDWSAALDTGKVVSTLNTLPDVSSARANCTDCGGKYGDDV